MVRDDKSKVRFVLDHSDHVAGVIRDGNALSEPKRSNPDDGYNKVGIGPLGIL